MRTYWTFVLLAAIAALAGCDGSPLDLTPPGGTNFGDEEFTIGLVSISGPDHIAESERYRERTQATTGWPNVRAIHKAGSSDLIFGQYRTPDAAQSDLRRAQAFKAPGSGQQIYRLARLIDVPGAKIGPPELDLANTTRGDYTVQIAVYIDDPKQNAYGRKRSAVERAKQLRQEGWDAYYFHGSTRSAVCIGLFGPESVKLKKSELAIVENRAVDPMAEQFILIDPKLQDIMAKFPKLAVNDREEWITSWNTKTGKNDMAPIESCVIKIPRPVIRTPLPVPTPESPYPVGTPPR